MSAALKKENPMAGRFLMGRWSATRKAIYALGVGQETVFPAWEYFNAAASVQRLNDAFQGARVWTIEGGRNNPKVTRIK